MCGLGESLELFGPWFLYFENKENDSVISETLSCSSRWSYLSLCNDFSEGLGKKQNPTNSSALFLCVISGMFMK